MTCPSHEALALAAFQGDLPSEVAAHVRAGCPTCARRLARLESIGAAFEGGPLPEVSKALHRLATAIPGRAARAKAPERKLQHLLASMVGGLFGAGPVPAMRGGPEVSSRRLLYRAEPYDIDLAMAGGDTLIGQIMADDSAESELGLDDPFQDALCVLYGETPRTTLLEPSGEFQFEAVSSGTYDLYIEWGDTRVLVPGVGIPSRAADRP